MRRRSEARAKEGGGPAAADAPERAGANCPPLGPRCRKTVGQRLAAAAPPQKSPVREGGRGARALWRRRRARLVRAADRSPVQVQAGVVAWVRVPHRRRWPSRGRGGGGGIPARHFLREPPGPGQSGRQARREHCSQQPNELAASMRGACRAASGTTKGRQGRSGGEGRGGQKMEMHGI